MKKALYTGLLLCTSLMLSVVSHAADPTNINELEAHLKSVSGNVKHMSADYKMDMNMAAASPQTPGMGNMAMSGKIKMLGDAMRMDIVMNMAMGEQTMKIKMKMATDAKGMMLMLMDINGFNQAMKMDINMMKEYAEEMGVPAAALDSSNMGAGMMQNPAKMIEAYKEMYDMKFVGKEKLGSEDVFVMTATIKPETLETMKKHPAMQQQSKMMEGVQTLYLGVKDGIMRKMVMGDFLTMTISNIDLKTPVTNEDIALVIPEGIQVQDLTAMMKTMYGK